MEDNQNATLDLAVKYFAVDDPLTPPQESEGPSGQVYCSFDVSLSRAKYDALESD